jgi:hypothetical protein
MPLINADGTPMAIAEDNAKLVDTFRDSQYGFEWDHELGQPIAVRGVQEVEDHVLDDLKDLRTQSANRREGEFMKVASIPVIVVDKWMREGFDVFKASAKEIVAKLEDEDMGHFMATSKSL